MLLKISKVLIIIILLSVDLYKPQNQQKEKKDTYVQGICTSTLVANVSEECMGNTHSNFLFPSCFSGQVMYVYDVNSYAKTLDSGCPQIQTSNVNVSEGCCAYYNASEDCGMRYYGPNGDLTTYSDCSGSVSCQKPVGWNDTVKECNQSVFLPQTNYMQLNFHCIEEIEICSICSCTVSGTSLYIWNGEYPNAVNDCSLASGCSCSITSSGSSRIQLIAFDIRFKMNLITGDCAQRLHIQDGESEFDIACDDHNAFKKRTVYISTSNHIKLRLDNSLEGSNGYFWLQVKAFDSIDTLSLHCGKENATYSCNDNFTIISENVTEFVLSEQERITPESGNGVGIGTIIGVVVAIIVIVVLTLLAYRLWKRYKDKNTKVDPKPDPEQDTDDDDVFNNNDQTPITSRAPEAVLIRMKTNV